MYLINHSRISININISKFNEYKKDYLFFLNFHSHWRKKIIDEPIFHRETFEIKMVSLCATSSIQFDFFFFFFTFSHKMDSPRYFYIIFRHKNIISSMTNILWILEQNYINDNQSWMIIYRTTRRIITIIKFVGRGGTERRNRMVTFKADEDKALKPE